MGLEHALTPGPVEKKGVPRRLLGVSGSVSKTAMFYTDKRLQKTHCGLSLLSSTNRNYVRYLDKLLLRLQVLCIRKCIMGERERKGNE